MRGRHRLLAGMAPAVVVAAVAAAAPAHESSRHKARAAADVTGVSTLERTIVGGAPSKGFQFLRPGPGEPHVVREELAKAAAGRAQRRRSLVYLAQLSDFQISDEESPARVEFLDPDPSGTATSAWRPQESLVALQVEYTMRQVNRFVRSPVPAGDGSRARMLNAVLTGDLADNQQRNETEAVLRLLTGGSVEPGSGTQRLDHPLCPPNGVPVRDFEQPRRYTGVQDYTDYLLAGPHFYDPADVRGIYAERGWPRYPGLLDRAQQPFDAAGLQVPSYVAFGNHDALVQGNAAANEGYAQIATGCVKPLAPVLDPTDAAQDPAGTLQRALTEPDKFMLVPRDPGRELINRLEFKDVFRGTGQGDAHGFAFVDPEELRASNGAASYYDFSPKPGVRYIVVDTVSEGGVPGESSNGNIDDPQFRWLESELKAAQERDELILVFLHHSIESLRSRVPDEAAGPCVGGEATSPGCDRDPRASTPLHMGADLQRLLGRFDNVVALVAGHSHENRVAPRPDPDGKGGFWEIKSPAVVDWPTQHRLIEVMDNRDGTLSIFGTMLDHAGPIEAPGGADATGFSSDQLVALGRTLAYNDPQVGPGADGEAGEPGEQPGDFEPGPEGQRDDRNVELLIGDPRAQAASVGGGDRPAEPERPVASRPSSRRGSAPAAETRPSGAIRPAAADAAPGGSFPLTGRDLALIVVLGAALAGAGFALRRRLT